MYFRLLHNFCYICLHLFIAFVIAVGAVKMSIFYLLWKQVANWRPINTLVALKNLQHTNNHSISTPGSALPPKHPLPH